jgi:Nuclear condensing complex subunits, C-term domain
MLSHREGLGVICLYVAILILPYDVQRLALSSIQLFFSQIPSSPEVLKLSILHVVFDMLMVHEHDLLAKDDNVSTFVCK